MFTIAQSVNKIQNRRIERHKDIIPACSSNSISELKRRTASALGFEIDPGYLKFLALSNGIEQSGYILYSCKEANQSVSSIEDIVEANLMWRDMGEWVNGIQIFGESDMDLYVKDMLTGKYQIILKTSKENVFGEFDTFEELIEHFTMNILD